MARVISVCMDRSYVIVGDGVAGASAAEALREADTDASITVVTDEGEPLYNRILIKEFAKGKLPAGPIAIHDEAWYADREIDLRMNTLVTDIDQASQTVTAHTGEEFGYDRLLLAIGGTPSQLPVPHSDADGIHHFWTFEDARAIKADIEAADDSVVIGAGLLGIDLAAITAAQEVRGHYLMRGNRWWRYALSEDGAEIIHTALRERDVTPVFGSGVDHFEVDDGGRVTAAIDPNGDRYPADFVGIAIGLNFNTEIVEQTDLEVDGGIIVDAYMRTNDPNIFAAGDVTQFDDRVLGARAQNGAWGSARQQGVIAARNMADYGTEPFEWVSSYSITHFDFPFLSFGHPTLGDDTAEARYSETEWRRVAFQDGRIVGGVLIGDLSPQSKFKQLMRDRRVVADQRDVLMQESFELEELDLGPTIPE